MPKHSNTLSFPKNFTWGVAAAATQIEGASVTDGKGESVWDRFAATPGKVFNGDTPAIACDHYHRFDEDFRLMKKLGAKNYRLSINWCRLYPQGDGSLNPAGVAFYDRLIDRLLAHGITPWVTFYHWDLPQALEDRGGWRSRITPDAFAPYANTVVKTLGDRVKRWITLNEIPCFIGLSLKDGIHAPGTKDSDAVVNQAYHHALLAHGHAVRAVREHGGRGATVGLTHNPPSYLPLTETPADIDAARKCFHEGNWHLLDPVFKGHYPAGYLRAAGADRPKVKKGDLALISQPTDFLGLNIYAGSYVQAQRKRWRVLPFTGNFPQADLPWLRHTPQSNYWTPRHVQELYGVKSIYITENGAGYEDAPDANGEIIDLHRREYLRNFILAAQRATAEGVPLKGYFLWSFMDNYEWSEGYRKRFGIVYVDYATQKRTPKLSAHWYSLVMKENRVV